MLQRIIVMLLLCFGVSNITFAQELSNEFTFEEYLAHVKKFHPLVKQADLILSNSEAKLLKARGAFDPKIQADFLEKDYHDTQYYSLFNGTFKIPTWYGIEIKAAFDNNEGYYLNPEHKTPYDGLTSLGITVPVGQGLWINERMAELKKGKLYVQLSEYERSLAAIEVLYDAAVAYMNWKQSYEKVQLYDSFLDNAEERLVWVGKSIELGELPRIDSVETGINVKTRKLELAEAELKLIKSRLELSNYLWTENNIPVELDENMVPEYELEDAILEVLNIDPLNMENSVEDHPKINALSTKIQIQEVDRRLKANGLLPKLDLTYNYLSEPNYFNEFQWDDYKIGATFSFPIFLRKERAALKMAKIKLQDAQYGLQFQQKSLENKILAKYNEINSYRGQIVLNSDLVNSYQQMLDAEVRLFEMGESSIFYINTRENKLVKAKISNIELKNTYFVSALDLYKALAIP
ncbi:Outer membrane efflux protein [Pustulibacterium marinum]|uniref:Outer membrane efflux protein n=1 Tax=Pustulibacterium marinum TaxID=1224947 RepID=A0A1I7FEP1_9FLAO|nr:TolC family protein [Pustulibacterium marinum]SFU34566.1 Outer membrane efflux protein [Pustulibacterium marinum]